MQRGLRGYVVRLSSLSLNEKEHQHVASLLQILSDMERISDYCENISEFAETLSDRKAEFSEKGTAELREMTRVCLDSYRYAAEAFAENDKEKALKVIEKESQADDLEIQLRSAHMKRLANNQCNTDAGHCVSGCAGVYGTYLRPLQEYCGGDPDAVKKQGEFMRLLFAEDEVSMSEAVSDILTYHHYMVDAVYDGEAALGYARMEAYDGIILDIMMPKIDGFGVLRHIRNTGNLRLCCF